MSVNGKTLLKASIPYSEHKNRVKDYLFPNECLYSLNTPMHVNDTRKSEIVMNKGRNLKKNNNREKLCNGHRKNSHLVRNPFHFILRRKL